METAPLFPPEDTFSEVRSFENNRENLESAVALQINNKYIKESFLYPDNSLSLPGYAAMVLGENFQSSMNQAGAILSRAEESGNRYIPFFSREYPFLLRQIQKFPPGLFARGKFELLQNPRKIAIVGTRHPSALSVAFTEFLSHYLASNGVTIVSGFAMGIDVSAHRSSLKERGGTIAVLAHGTDYVYPSANFDLYRRLDAEDSRMLFLSEYPPGTKPLRFHFPLRNRIIAGLSPATLFMEGGVKSGAGITVRYAASEGRDVGVFDHALLKNNEGGRSFLEEGAIPVAPYLDMDILKESAANLKKILENDIVFAGENRWISIRENENTKNFIPSFLG